MEDPVSSENHGVPRARTGRGRPVSNEKGVGRDAIIEITRVLLRTTPPTAITRLGVARAAKVDPALIRYYFGTTTHLIAEVVVDTHRLIELAMLEALEKDVPRSWLRQRLSRLVNLFVENPFHNQLIRHVMYADIGSDEHAQWVASLRRSIDLTRRQVQRGVEEGILRPVDPRFLHIVLLGICEFFGHNAPIVTDIFDGAETTRSLRDRFVEFVADLLEGGLHAR